MPTRDRRKPQLWLLIGPSLGMAGVALGWASGFSDEGGPPVWVTVVFGLCALCFLTCLVLVFWGRRRSVEAGHSLHLDEPGAGQITEREDGVLELRPTVAVPASEAWFWTERWQAGEKAVDAHVAAGEGTAHETADDFLAHLDALDAE